MISHRLAITLLRASLAITFLWFGILKLFNVSPVLDIIVLALPPLLSQSQIFILTLAIVEIVIGILLLVNKFIKPTSLVMIVHLIIASLSVLATQGFAPNFPLLSLAGEFVTKNLVLIAAGFVLFAESSEVVALPTDKGGS